MFPCTLQIALAEEVDCASDWTAAPSAAEDTVAEELAKFQGAWVLVYWLYNGEQRAATEAKITLTFVGGHFVIRRKGDVIEDGRFEGLDPHQTPKAFTYAPTTVGGRPFHKKFPAIYWLEDDLLIACVGYRGERPKGFSAEAGSDRELVIYKRVRG